MGYCPEGHITNMGYCTICDTGKTQKKQKKTIKKQSVYREEGNKKYQIARIEFLSEPQNQKCAVYPYKKATQVHHKKGRTGSLLYDKRYFLPVSDEGHEFIHNNHDWAINMGFKILRSTE